MVHDVFADYSRLPSYEKEHQLQKGLASERETGELREQFIAVLGHDLRNPLAAISAGARILQRSGALQQQKELRVLDMINSTVTRMSDLIDNILDFARGGWAVESR
jgi:phosphoserine phosphatase RsbU/P